MDESLKPMPNTIALFASSRRLGNTGQLMDDIAKELEIEVIDLAEKDISPFDYQHRNRNDDFEHLMEHVLQHDKILFASPIYWYAVSPPMKCFLDRISDYLDLPDLLEKGRLLRGKAGYVICTSVYDEPCVPFLDAFRMTFGYLGMNFGGHLNINCKTGYDSKLFQDHIQGFIEKVRLADPVRQREL